MKIIITILLIVTFQISKAQGVITLQTSLDPKMTLFGDAKRNIDAGLSNVLIKSRWTGMQQKYGYVHVGPTFEFAQLSNNLPKYYRYSAELGYTFNKLWIENVELGIYANYGIIKRGMGSTSFGFGIVVGYKLNTFLRLTSTLQWTQRADLNWLYGLKPQIKHSVFIGIEITIFDALKDRSKD